MMTLKDRNFRYDRREGHIQVFYAFYQSIVLNANFCKRFPSSVIPESRYLQVWTEMI